jgi:hypothetical protein
VKVLVTLYIRESVAVSKLVPPGSRLLLPSTLRAACPEAPCQNASPSTLLLPTFPYIWISWVVLKTINYMLKAAGSLRRKALGK